MSDQRWTCPTCGAGWYEDYVAMWRGWFGEVWLAIGNEAWSRLAISACARATLHELMLQEFGYEGLDAFKEFVALKATGRKGE